MTKPNCFIFNVKNAYVSFCIKKLKENSKENLEKNILCFSNSLKQNIWLDIYKSGNTVSGQEGTVFLSNFGHAAGEKSVLFRLEMWAPRANWANRLVLCRPAGTAE